MSIDLADPPKQDPPGMADIQVAVLAVLKAAREARIARGVEVDLPKSTPGTEDDLDELTPQFPDLADKLSKVPPGKYDEVAAFVLSVASTWAYSDPITFAEAMRPLGWANTARPEFDGGIATKVIQNDALLVKTTVSFLQAGKVGILCFRGTEPTNALQWLSNASFGMEPFFTWGRVHTGFYRSLTPALPFVFAALKVATDGEPVLLDTQVQPFGGGIQLGSDMRMIFDKSLFDRKRPKDIERMEALYITGHSLGGALAVLTAAMLYKDERFAAFRNKLRGVYTFGQPLVGDQEFCDTAEETFGKDLVFRHIYGRDIVPRLPPRLTGAFRSFGQEFVSTSKGWTRRRASVRQAATLSATVAVGAAAWYAQQLPFLNNVELPFNLADHMPNNYMGCSQLSLPAFH